MEKNQFLCSTTPSSTFPEPDTELVRPARDLFDWKKVFEYTSVGEKVGIIVKTILNILHNFIPHET